jgi:predicted nucleic acid-binding protein
VTVWPAITEAMYLLSSWPDMQGGLLEWLELGSVKLATLEAEDMPRVRELMTKYRDRHIDFADAALVRVAERDKLRRVFTVDKKDFNVYRILRTGRFSILP